MLEGSARSFGELERSRKQVGRVRTFVDLPIRYPNEIRHGSKQLPAIMAKSSSLAIQKGERHVFGPPISSGCKSIGAHANGHSCSRIRDDLWGGCPVAARAGCSCRSTARCARALARVVLGSRSEKGELSSRSRVCCGLVRRVAVRLHEACQSPDAIGAAVDMRLG